MPRDEYTDAWYHGSPEKLDMLRKGSWVTPFSEVAKAFSHRPSRMSISDSCQTVKHNGKLPGFLYLVSEAIGPDDVSCLPDTDETHWQTQRDLQVRLIEQVPVDDPPLLSEEDMVELRKIMPDGTTGYVSKPNND